MSALHGIFGSRAAGSGPRTALVVDSDSRCVRTLAMALRREGMDVLEATSFQEGKSFILSQPPDILVVDIRLGQFNGLQLLMRAQVDRPDIQAIITSPVPDPVLEAETRRFGGIFMIKPIDPVHVVEAVRQSVPTRPLESAMKPSEQAAPPSFFDRRQADRRVVVIPQFLPDRRIRDRRNTPG